MKMLEFVKRVIRTAIGGSQQRVDMPLTVAEAQRQRVCRICKLNNTPSPGNPLVLNYGEEYAHKQCLKRHIDQALQSVPVTDAARKKDSGI